MSTKPDGETGWNKELPEAQGWYWVRSGPVGLPVAVEFFPALMDRSQPMVRYPGKNGFMVAVAEDAKPEWLGPISPSDFEQLRRLREAAALCAIPYEALLADSKSKEWIAPKVWTAIENAVDALREALTSVNNLRDGKPPH